MFTENELSSIQSEYFLDNDDGLRDLLNKLRLNPTLTNSQVYKYTYLPIVGMTSQTDPNGITTYYEYDSFGRLEYILDNDRNILKSHKYNYADQDSGN